LSTFQKQQCYHTGVKTIRSIHQWFGVAVMKESIL